MQIDFSAELMMIDGKETIKASNSDETARTLRSVCVEALLFSDQAKETAQNKIKRFMLAQKIEMGETEFSVDDISMIKTEVGKGYNALIVGRAFELLDPVSVKQLTPVSDGETQKDGKVKEAAKSQIES